MYGVGYRLGGFTGDTPSLPKDREGWLSPPPQGDALALSLIFFI